MKHPLPWFRTPSPGLLRLICCLALELCLLGLPAGAEVAVTDDQGRMVRLHQPAGRIIALYGAFNEILADLGQAELIVARTAADELPASILCKPSIGTHLRPNAELILALRPDLVLQLGGRSEAMEPVRFLEERGLTVAVFDMENFPQLFSTMERIGTLTGCEHAAKEQVATMRAELERIRSSRTGTRPRIFFEVRYPNLLAAGQESIVSEIMSLAGGINCVQIPNKLVRLGEEEVLRLDPDIYLMQHGPMNPIPVPLPERPFFRTLSSLREGQFFVVDQGVFSRPGPRSLEAVRQLSRIVHGWQNRSRP